MADTKISALTGATTPLAGTEVLPIVQSGATVKVAVSDLTAGRAVSAASLSLTGSALPIASGGTAQTSFTAGQVHYGSFSTSADLYWDNTNSRLSIGKGASPSYKLDIAQATGAAQRLATTTQTASTCTQYFEVANDFSATSQSFVQGIGSGVSGVSQLAFGVALTAAAATATDVARFDTAGNFRPSADNTYSCGTGALRWSVIYSATALINTSDGTLKSVIGGIDEAEKRVAQRIKAGIKKFKFNESIAEKGDAARIHWGVVAQDVKASFQAEGLNAEQYSMFCSDTWFEKDGQRVLAKDGEIMTSGDAPDGAVKITRLGIRYEELFAFVIASL